MKKKKDFFICPHCGEAVPVSAPACPGCGSDNETGWNEDFVYAEPLYDEERQETIPRKSRSWVKYVITGLTMLLVSALLVALLSWGIFLVPFVLVIMAVVFYFTQVYPNTTRAVEKRLEKQLLYMVNGDREKVNRLVLYEQMRRPVLKRHQLLENAIYRLQRDRR